MIDINQVADYFISRADVEAGDVMTHLKLQKLTYYAQAWNLAITGEPLVGDDFQAWAHGPVAPVLYARFAGYSWNAIPLDAIDGSAELDDDVTEHLEEIWGAYGQYSAKTLERLTHSEDPWLDARGGIEAVARCTVVIPQEAMRQYYGAQLVDGSEE